MPVAIVNLDEGAEFNETELTIGKDLVKELKEKKDFDWHFVSQKEANEGSGKSRLLHENRNSEKLFEECNDLAGGQSEKT